MAFHNTAERYGSGPRLLHWLIAALVIGALILIQTRGWWPRGSALRRGFREWHQQAALVAFALVWLRLAVRLVNQPPLILPPQPPWQERASKALHVLFYVLLIGLPVIGMVMVQLDGRTVSLFGLALPQWFAPDKNLTHQFERVHTWLGNVMIGAITLHVAAALWHHYVRRDNALRRML